MSRLLAVLLLSSSLALAVPAAPLPAGYKIEKTVVSGTRQIVIAWRSQVVNSRVIPGDKTLSDSTLVMARDSRTGNTLWRQKFPNLLKLGSVSQKTVEVSTAGQSLRVTTRYILSAQTGRILQTSEVLRISF